MLDRSDLIAALRSVPRITTHGPWARSIDYSLTKGPPPGRPPGNPAEPSACPDHFSRSKYRLIFPVAVFGSSSAKVIVLGHL